MVFTLDEEGLGRSSDGDARWQAIRGARSPMSADVRDGTFDLEGQIVVTGDRNDAVMTVRFRDAVAVREG